MPSLRANLDIVDVDQDTIVDPNVRLRLANPSEPSGGLWKLKFDGTPLDLTLKDAPAGDPLRMRIDFARYHPVALFVPVRDERLRLQADTLKTPRQSSEWLPQFTAWNDLGGAFTRLKTALGHSKQFELGRDTEPGEFTGPDYDAIDDSDDVTWLAKMAMLNIYTRLAATAPPSCVWSWFEEESVLLQANRERLISVTTDRCAEMVRNLAARKGGGYKGVPSDLHHENFIRLRGVSDVRNLASIKTEVERANLQLTVCDATYNGKAVRLLDADIDEHGGLIPHLFDLVRHTWSGGTHPIDIHEALRALFPESDPGYALRPKRGVPRVSVKVQGATV